MSTKAYYPISEIGAGKPSFSKTRSIIENGLLHHGRHCPVSLLTPVPQIAEDLPPVYVLYIHMSFLPMIVLLVFVLPYSFFWRSFF